MRHRAAWLRAAPHAVVLLNGDKIITSATPGGTRFGSVVSAAKGINGALVTLRLGRKTYEVPVAALPYLGRGLDPSLFDVTALIGRETGGRLPVRVGFQGRPPALPGVQVTHKGSAAEDGYLTASSAKLFGAALARQFRADHPRGSYGKDGMFARGVSVSLAGTTPRPVVTPAFVMHTLTVRGTNLSGKPAEGDFAFVFNVDNSSLFSDPIESLNDFFHGVAKFSVPGGHYWALGGVRRPVTRIVAADRRAAPVHRGQAHHRAGGRARRDQRDHDGDAQALGRAGAQPGNPPPTKGRLCGELHPRPPSRRALGQSDQDARYRRPVADVHRRPAHVG